ncbi:MAG: S41 family peptidase [Bdellovibrionales bacterium]
MVRFLFLPAFVLSAFSFGSVALASAPRCQDVLAQKEVTLDTLQDSVSQSRFRESFKLEMARLIQVLETQYGPLSFKMQSTGQNWEQIKRETLREAGAVTDDYQMYVVFSRFLSKLNDGHVSVQLPSTLSWEFPLQFHVAENRLFVGHIELAFPKNIEKPGIGDELLLINGMTPQKFQSLFPQFNADGNPLTNLTSFAYRLSRFRESRGFPLSRLPWTTLDLRLKRAGSEQDFYDLRVPIKIVGTGLISSPREGFKSAAKGTPVPPEALLEASSKPQLQFAGRVHQLFKTKYPQAPSRVRSKISNASNDGSLIMLGAVEPFFALPSNFKRIDVRDVKINHPQWKNTLIPDMFFAGTFERNGKRVGFLRVPSYGPDFVDQHPETIQWLAFTTRYIIGRLQAESDYLILDQTNNPGGFVTMSDLLIKALTGSYQHDRHIKFAVKPTQGFLRSYQNLIDVIRQNEDGLLSPQEVQSFVRQLEVEFAKVHKAFTERRDLSEPVSLLPKTEYSELTADREYFKNPLPAEVVLQLGVDIQKHQTYTKPIFFMINEYAFSGGDATPALFQDYGRGLLIGTREKTQTGGAGGTVENFNFRSVIEARVSLTSSLMVRYDGRLIENYGVKADLNIPIRAEDVQDSYQNYFERVKKVIDEWLVNPKNGDTVKDP